MRYAPFYLLLPLIVVACGGADAKYDADDIQSGDTLVSVDFEEADGFETGDYDEEQASLNVEDGVYRLRQAGDRTAYIWGQGGDEAANVVIEADAASQTEFENNLYGVMCRVNADGEGYAFLISNDGFGSIAYAVKGAAERPSLTFIFDWVENDAINGGQSDNTIRAVCIDDYLALYVNGEFVGDVEDDRFADAGQAGVLAGIFIEERDETGEVIVEFDNLTVSEGSLQ